MTAQDIANKVENDFSKVYVPFEDFQQYCIENGEKSDATMRFASA